MAYSQHHPPHPALCTVRTLLRALTAASLCNLYPAPCSVLSLQPPCATCVPCSMLRVAALCNLYPALCSMLRAPSRAWCGSHAPARGTHTQCMWKHIPIGMHPVYY